IIKSFQSHVKRSRPRIRARRRGAAPPGVAAGRLLAPGGLDSRPRPGYVMHVRDSEEYLLMLSCFTNGGRVAIEPHPTPRRILSPRERRERNREEMVAAILETARDVMRAEGVAALTLSEVARRLGVTSAALYRYFPGKAALYDALFRLGIRTVHAAFEQ